MTKPTLALALIATILGMNLIGWKQADRSGTKPKMSKPSEERDVLDVDPNDSASSGRRAHAAGAKGEKASPRDDRPIPQIHRTESLLGRTIGEHFRSHPPTEMRLLYLRQLMRGGEEATRPDDEPFYPGDSQPGEQDLLSLAVDLKNDLSRLSTEIFADSLAPITLQQEWQEGVEMHKELLKDLKIDSAASLKLRPIIESLKSHLNRTRGQPYMIHVIDSDVVNAFAHQGGHIYVFQGLIDIVREEHELLFVLGHEMAHIELNQCARAASGSRLAEGIAGKAAAQAAARLQKLMTLGYSEYEEHDADAWSYRVMKRMGKSDRQVNDFFYRLIQHEQSQ